MTRRDRCQDGGDFDGPFSSAPLSSVSPKTRDGRARGVIGKVPYWTFVDNVHREHSPVSGAHGSLIK